MAAPFLPAAYAVKSPCDRDRKSTRLNSSHSQISYAVFCLKKKNIVVARSAVCTPTATLIAAAVFERSMVPRSVLEVSGVSDLLDPTATVESHTPGRHDCCV